ncbi:hypothetical protein M427DRAFT_400302 [Gonapodya prolifera JEL478]|uniref:Uncharacterized protein n=1 Tax=Gonapodya prolifera (strain JEL478) TaxID=1344416 RepID=A0A139ATG3_GONPJ|nr:hypothetical protein M427DRAFT_400302 [Gonapodya prolifera JEL478]|eukprot:KXS20018.1 hypothetical protein M427DRAFT_400302 [Gonapodya prolifera JEL478]
MLNCCIYLKRKRGGIRIKRRASKKSRSDVTGDIPGFFAEVGSSRENENSPLPSTGDNYRTLLLGLDGQLPPVIPDIASRAMGRGAEKLRSLLDAGAATSGTALVKLFDRITDDRSVLAGDGSHSSVSQSLSHPVSLMRSSVATGQHGADGWDLDESDLFPTHEVSFAETASTEGKCKDRSLRLARKSVPIHGWKNLAPFIHLVNLSVSLDEAPKVIQTPRTRLFPILMLHKVTEATPLSSIWTLDCPNPIPRL